MYIDTATNLDGLFTSGAGADLDRDQADQGGADGRAKLDAALREVLAAKVQLKYHVELLPALHESARAFAAFLLVAAVVRRVHTELADMGAKVEIPACLAVDPVPVPEVIAALVVAGLIDSNDVLVADLPRPPASAVAG